MVLSYNRPTGHLPKGKGEGTYREMYSMYVKSYEHNCLRLSYVTGGNWQKWKRVFLTCPCHKIYRDEAVGLKSCKYTWKITKFVKMGNLG